MKDVWNELLEFESKDLLERFFKNYHNSDINDWKVQEVSSNFIQGREYFKSTRDASITVKPLLLYYGIVSLSRGLTLILRPKLREANLKGSHGLEVKNWSEVLTSRNFEEIRVVVGEGTFSDLINATDNCNYLRVDADGVNFKTSLISPPDGYSIHFRDLFNFLPDLDKEFKIWTNDSLPTLTYSAHNLLRRVSEKNTMTVWDRGESDEFISKFFPGQFCSDRTIDRFDNRIIVRYNQSKWSPNYTQRWYGALNLGDMCIAPVLDGDIGFNSLSAMFAISYVLGMMARYFPSTWISLGRVQKGDKIFPLVNKSLNFLQEIYPQAVLDFLRAPYKFEQPNNM